MSLARKGTYRGREIASTTSQGQQSKNASELTRIEIDIWAGKALECYFFLDEKAQNTKIEEGRRRTSYSMGQTFKMNYDIIKLLLTRMATRDQVIEQKNAEIKTLRKRLDDSYKSRLM